MDSADLFPPTDRPHDRLFRIVFQDAAHATALIRSAMARDPGYAHLIPHIDWSKLRRIHASVVDAVDRDFDTDLLFEAPLRLPDGCVLTVLFSPILEHKSYVDPETAWQSLRYQVRHIDWHRAQPGRKKSWPIVITLVVYHGDVPWDAPRDMRDLFELPDSIPASQREAIRGLLPSSRYLVDDLRHRPDAPTSDFENAVFAYLAIEFFKHLRNCDAQTLRHHLIRLAPFFDRSRAHPNRRALLSSLSWYAMTQSRFEPKLFQQTIRTVLPKDTSDDMCTPFGLWLRTNKSSYEKQWEKQLQKKLEKRLEKQAQRKYLAQGREEGKAEGQLEGQATALLKVLTSRFGPVPDATQQRIQSAPLAALDRWLTQALIATTMEDALRD